MLLYLVRHAVTAETGRRLTGWTPGVHLSEAGERQAGELARRMQAIRLDAVYASPVDRALETAKRLAASQGLRVRVREGLGEVRYGAWEGRSLRQLAGTTRWRQAMSHPSGVRFPGGETLRETQHRALEAVSEVVGAHPRSAAVVSHADVIKLVVAYYAGVPIDLYARLGVAPASVSVLQVGDGAPRILKLNDTGALDPGPRPGGRGKGRGARTRGTMSR